MTKFMILLDGSHESPGACRYILVSVRLLLTMYGCLLSPSLVFSKDGKRIYPNEVETPLCEHVYATHLGGDRLEFYKDGFVKVDSATEEEALQRLNCLILSFKLIRLAGRYIPVIKADDLCTVVRNTVRMPAPLDEEGVKKMLAGEDPITMGPDPEFTVGTSKYASFRSVFIMHGEWRKDFIPLINITVDELKVIAELADRIFVSSMMPQLLTFIEAWTLRDDVDWNTGFILSWICIESMVFNQIINSYRSDPDAIYQKDQKGKVKHHKDGRKMELSSHAAIEKLRMGLANHSVSFASTDASAFDDQYLTQIQSIREIRNEIVHGDRRATKRELEECFQASGRALWRIMKLGGIGNYPDYLERMKGKQSESEKRLSGLGMKSS